MLDFTILNIAIDQLSQFLGGSTGKQVLADCLALKASFVLCRNIDPLVFSDRQVLRAVRGDYQHFSLGLIAFAGQDGQLVDSVNDRVLGYVRICQSGESGKQIDLADQSV